MLRVRANLHLVDNLRCTCHARIHFVQMHFEMNVFRNVPNEFFKSVDSHPLLKRFEEMFWPHRGENRSRINEPM